MRIWVDDIRPAPENYIWCKSVKATIEFINRIESLHQNEKIDLIDLDHDAGEYVHDDGDYIKILDWLEEHNKSYNIRIHSMNPVGVQNMRSVIIKNGWNEVK